MKWNRCERSWIKQSRIYCRKLFGFKFSLERFHDLIVKLHSVFKGTVGIFKDKLPVEWDERWDFKLTIDDDTFKFDRLTSFFDVLFRSQLHKLIFIWYWESIFWYKNRFFNLEGTDSRNSN
jgi:hypothetical protein